MEGIRQLSGSAVPVSSSVELKILAREEGERIEPEGPFDSTTERGHSVLCSV